MILFTYKGNICSHVIDISSVIMTTVTQSVSLTSNYTVHNYVLFVFPEQLFTQ